MTEVTTPTVVLVHGAFADAGSWAAVTERLVAAGVPVRAIANPLRGVAVDAAYVAGVINQIPGPVLAVGHSYGGAIITNAVPQTTNVVGLVYVAAFAPDEGEALADIVAGSKDSVLTSAVQPSQYPTGGGESATELIIDPARFRAVFTADLPQLQSDVLGLSQRPIAAAAFEEKNGPAAWRSDLPVWAAVGTADLAAGSDVVRTMAQRAGADITEIEGSHVIMISQPDAVTRVIRGALASLI
ncbi:Pimeloyl-ACP methyl ester carboxylesterase [Streptomyces sp. DvalAA-14]|uniref:alpha/beta fold hydrolase n=1 Tax=unclassified Streptomyces TaxID=2593676 RepID=UPI00081B5F15|nr:MULTISPECIES: alpha/beta hydrolase [unclassified Streptomyces]MYS23793.1 alpha/beta fold hydrolase [Streptomyces sp. SID4948]SCE38745.1 Pimeloyl-ACP methyl ester carboxylesterase [Streptomyces sp. DvalAA-14]